MRSRVNLPIVLFGILVALCLVTAIAFVIEETPYEDVPAPGGGVERIRAGHGVTHPAFASMDHGGSGAERHAPILCSPGPFGLLQLALIVGCLMLGLRPFGRLATGSRRAASCSASLFTMMVATYRGYLATAPRRCRSSPCRRRPRGFCTRSGRRSSSSWRSTPASSGMRC